MKSYLSLIPISAKIHKRQNRMTILCIMISVVLVTTIFSMVDMVVQGEKAALLAKHGNWHYKIEGLSYEIADEINRRPDVAVVGWSENYNSDTENPYYVGEKLAILYGTDESYMLRIADGIEDGSFPKNDNEVLLTSNARTALSVSIGDRITIHTPAGEQDYKVSGFGSDDQKYYRGQTYLVGVSMTQNAFTALMEKNGIEPHPVCYVQFQSASKAVKAVSELRQHYNLPEDSISENKGVMGLSGQSSSSAMENFYLIAVILFVLVLLAGVLMISGSMNSNVAQRTQFFGMLRCIGASRQQIIRFVRLEALNWCRTAVPFGVIAGTVCTWALCAILRYGIGGEFQRIPVFGLSPVGICSGALVGMVTVLLAAHSPAKRAAKVSPMAAVSGNTEEKCKRRRIVQMGFGRIEHLLGVQHATTSRKNWFMMTASFALSIILFLCFSVGMDFARELLPSMRSWQPDVTIFGYGNTPVLEQGVIDEIDAIPGVAHTYAYSYANCVPTKCSRDGIQKISIVGYSDYFLDASADRIIQGDWSAIYGNTNQVATVRNKDNPLQVGDSVQIDGKDVSIACILSDAIFDGEQAVICSQETFDRLVGKQNYSFIGVQLGKNATDETVEMLSRYASEDVVFADIREQNREDRATYFASRLVGYGFLTIIAMITLFNIVNSISMSVTARVRQYGAMRAVGMDGDQLTRMITTESLTYSCSGLIVGCGIGLILSRFIHAKLITHYFGIAWYPPVVLLMIIIVFVALSTAVAVHAPAKRMRNMAVTDTLTEL